MLKTLFRYMPTNVIWLSNLVFWLVLNSVAADHTHRTRLMYGRESDYLQVWIEYLPWWGNWAILAPFIIAMIKKISHETEPSIALTLKALWVSFLSMFMYWSMTVVEVTLLNQSLSSSWEGLQISLHRLLLSPLHMDLLVYFAVAGIGFTISFYEKGKRQALSNQKLSSQLLEVELEALKSQLNPHFLFNTLNTISGLIRLEQKGSAVKALSELSSMFRKVLENQRSQLTTLKNEMDFINSYLVIQKMRFESKIDLQVDCSPDCFDVELPFMLLHTLVENAVQHGSQLESEQNLMRLTIAKDKNMLNVDLINKASCRDDHKGFGIGLKNCRKRLEHLYNNQYMLDVNSRDDGYYETHLSIPVGK